MAYKYFLGSLSLVFFSKTVAEVPSYIHICKQNDPDLNKCVLNSVGSLKPKLVEGIPELDIPSLEPLNLTGLVVQRGLKMLKFNGSNFIMRGLSDYEVKDLKMDLPNKQLQVKMTFRKVTVDGDYEVNGKFLNLNIHGKGPIHVEAEDTDGIAIIKGKRPTIDGKEYFVLDSMDLKLNIKNYEAKLSKGFFKEPAVTDAINAAIHENKREIIELTRPQIETTVRDVLLNVANKITKRFTYEQLFPKN